MANPIVLGLYMVTGVVMSFYKINVAKSRLVILLHSLSLFLFSIVCALTLSRNAYASLLLVFLIFASYKILVAKNIIIKYGQILASIFLFSIFIYIVNESFDNIVISRLLEMLDSGATASDPRLEKWGVLFNSLMSDNPLFFLWGFGLGNIGTTGLGASEKFLIVENSYIAIIFELGLIGLLFYVYFIYRYCRNALKLLLNYDLENRRLGMLLLLYVGFLLVSSNFADSLYMNYPFNLIFWLFFVVSEVAKRQNESVYQENLIHE